jgi:glycerol-3-phosphate dehydrogenase (NAD(P)+)
MEKITVLGAGHWGLALASVLASNNKEVLMYARDDKKALDLNLRHESVYIKDYKFSELIKATSNLDEAMEFSDTIIISIPVVSVYMTLLPYLKKFPNKNYVFTSKGLYNGKTMSSLFYNVNKDLHLAVLSGPSFSNEVIEKKNTAVVIASKNTSLAKELQCDFSNNYFRVYTSEDITGVETCGAIKNVFAIICGMVDGAKMGSNTKNALITRGLAEMKRMITFTGGNLETLYGLAGIGDIMLTCNSFESRNYSYGFQYTSGKKSEASGVVEGLNTIKELHTISELNKIDMPITNSLYEVLFNNKDIREMGYELMNRKLKNE